VCVGESVHDHGSYEWHCLYVHCDGNERQWYWCRVNRFCCSHALDGSWCAHWCVCNLECEWSVGCFLDRPIEWWCGDHWLHSDPVHLDHSAGCGVVCSGESVHDLGSHEWHRLYVHSDSNERQRYWRSFGGVGCCDPFNGSRCSDWCVRYQ